MPTFQSCLILVDWCQSLTLPPTAAVVNPLSLQGVQKLTLYGDTNKRVAWQADRVRHADARVRLRRVFTEGGGRSTASKRV